MLEALEAVTVYRPIAEQVISLCVAESLVRIISQTKDFRSYVVSLAIEALWNLIEVVGKEAVDDLATYPEVFKSLKPAFENVLKHGFKKDDKCIRNEICLLINFILQNARSHKFFLSMND